MAFYLKAPPRYRPLPHVEKGREQRAHPGNSAMTGGTPKAFDQLGATTLIERLWRSCSDDRFSPGVRSLRSRPWAPGWNAVGVQLAATFSRDRTFTDPYFVSTVTASTIGADGSGPLTNSIAVNISLRPGVTVR